MKVKVAFFKVSSVKSDWKNKLIGWYTRSKYSHAELIVGDMMYSSSPDESCVRGREHIVDNEQWDYIDVYVPNYNSMVNFISLTIGSEYDSMGIFGFVIPFQDSERRYFCSEWVSKALLIGGVNKFFATSPSRISPGRLYSLLKAGSATGKK